MIIVIQTREMGIFSGRGSGSGCSVATAHPIPGDLLGVAPAARALTLRGGSLMPDATCYSSRECCQSLSSAHRE